MISASYPWFSDTLILPDCYEELLTEISPHLSIGQIVMRGKVLDERRSTCMYSNTDSPMTYTYAGRTVVSICIKDQKIIKSLFELVNSPAFQAAAIEREPRLAEVIPQFNVLFVNWYRPPHLSGEKRDYIGPHSDKLKDHASEVILSITFCEKNGERLFRFFDKNDNLLQEYEFPTGAMLWMLPGCQQNYRHAVVQRKTNLKREKITGGRLNLTFRCFKM